MLPDELVFIISQPVSEKKHFEHFSMKFYISIFMIFVFQEFITYLISFMNRTSFLSHG